MFWIAAHNFFSTDVAEIIIQNFFTQKFNQSLDILSHVFLCLCLLKIAEVEVWERILEELDIELVTGEHLYVVDRLVDAKVCQALISKLQNFLNN